MQTANIKPIKIMYTYKLYDPVRYPKIIFDIKKLHLNNINISGYTVES